MAQVNIVEPGLTYVVTETMEEPLQRRNGQDGPIADQRNARTIRGTGLGWAPDLDGEANGLGKQDRDQNENIFETCEKRFHQLGLIIRELGPQRRWRDGCGRQLFSGFVCANEF